MDGVLADFDAHYEATFGIRFSTLADDVDWDRVRAVKDFYLNIPPMADMEELFSTGPLVVPFVPPLCLAMADLRREPNTPVHMDPIAEMWAGPAPPVPDPCLEAMSWGHGVGRGAGCGRGGPAMVSNENPDRRPDTRPADMILGAAVGGCPGKAAVPALLEVM